MGEPPRPESSDAVYLGFPLAFAGENTDQRERLETKHPKPGTEEKRRKRKKARGNKRLSM